MVADVSRPGTTGSDFVGRARKIAPRMAVIVMTEDIEAFRYDLAVESGAADFIRKPFSARELLYRLKHVIDREALRTLSVTDELTGLFNRRGFYTLTGQQLKLARRQRKGIYMLYADVDGLKGINDGWNHQEGDRALVDVATILKRTYRESDIIARIGGDEFTVVPIGSRGDDMRVIAARLMENLDAHNAREIRPYKLRLSVGMSYYDPDSPCTIDELLARGDRSMYEDKKRKRSGRP